MTKRTFEVELQVRGYELDSFGHVNNAVYLNYLEVARWNIIEQCTGGVDYFRKVGLAPIVAKVEITYLEPCALGECLVVESKIAEATKRVAEFEHIIRKKNSGRPAAEARVSVVPVEISSGKTAQFPTDFAEIFLGPH